MARLTAQDLISDNLQLVSLPDVVYRINEAVEDPNTSAVDIASLIAEDPAMTARLLQVVNSAAFNFPARIDTISMAITILGTGPLRDLVLATATIDRFHDLTNEVVDMETFWRHSIATAVASRTLANRLRLPNSERLFVAGLLHDIGKLVMYVTHPDASRQVIELTGEDDLEKSGLEHAVFGFSHAEVGAELIRRWQLPEVFIEPTLYHHKPVRATDYKQETAIVHIADTIANQLQAPISADDVFPINTIALTMLNLEADAITELETEVREILDQSIKIFFIDNRQAA